MPIYTPTQPPREVSEQILARVRQKPYLPFPLTGIDASKAGSGKGILAHSVAMIATGRSASIISPPSIEEEWGKVLTAMLMEGQTIICIDNVTGRLQEEKIGRV